MRSSALGAGIFLATATGILVTRLMRSKARKNKNTGAETSTTCLRRPLKIIVLNPCNVDRYRNANVLMLKEWFAAAGVPAELTEIYVCENNVQFPDWSAFDGAIIPGSPASAYDDEVWITPLFGAIKDLDARAVPTIGICFGHQAIAQALGGQVEPHGQEVQTCCCHFRPNATAEKFLGLSADRDATFLCNHHDIVTALPPHAEALGRGPVDPHPLCIYRASSRTRPHIVTVQVHPEMSTVTGREVLRDIMLNRNLPKYGKSWYDARLSTIGREGKFPIQLLKNTVSLLWPHYN